MRKSKDPQEPKTSVKVKHEMGIGLKTGHLTKKQTQSLAGSVGAHIEPRGRGKSPRGGNR
jgi:hypothetical protein